MLVLKNIDMQYKDNKVLKNINLALPDRGLIFIIGASGSGKSTLLNIIAGYIKPTSGSVYYNGRDITKFNNKELNKYLANDVAVIHQHYDLIRYLTVDDNLKLKNRYYDHNILSELGIEHLRNKRVNKLSGGEEERVAIARALINSSSIILADEPTGALDSKNSKKIIKILKRLSKSRLVLVVTHNVELTGYGDRVITIKDGVVKKDVDNYKLINNRIKHDNKKYKRNIFSIIYKNLLMKYKRNILTMIAFSIGLITLLIVLGISNGFNRAMDECEKTILASYPISISEDSYNVDDELANIFGDSNEEIDGVIVRDNKHKNIIDEKFMNFIGSLNIYSKRIEYSYLIGSSFITSVDNVDDFYDDIEIIEGRRINNDKELILLIDENNSISTELGKLLNLNVDKYDYSDLLNRKIKINKNIFNVVGIAKGDSESFYNDCSGLYSVYRFKDIPFLINIIPKSYSDKLNIIDNIREYGDIEFSDYASSIKRLSTNIVDGISAILIVFSFISLIVSSFMIGIITYISILERTKEIGILKSIGYSNRDVKNIFYLENIIISILSSTIAIIFVYIVSIPSNRVLFNLTGFSNLLSIDINMIYFIYIVGLIITFIGSIIPTFKIKKLDIVSALNYEQ